MDKRKIIIGLSLEKNGLEQQWNNGRNNELEQWKNQWIRTLLDVCKQNYVLLDKIIWLNSNISFTLI